MDYLAREAAQLKAMTIILDMLIYAEHNSFQNKNMQRINPVHLTGALRHCYLWATSGSSDVYIANKNFNPDHPMPRTIYCIHGTADRTNSFSLIAERIKDELSADVKGTHIITFNNRFSGASISDFTKQLAERIKQNKDANVILMGHSRGALVATEYALNFASIDEVYIDSVINICGPFRGSYAAWPLSYISTSVSEMQTDSDYLKNLSVQIEQSTIRFFYAGAESDYLVTGDSFMPYHINKSCESVLLLDRHGHLSINSSHRLVKWIADRLRHSLTQEMTNIIKNP